MNKIAKKIGIAALVVALLCNLQYSLFFSVKDNPSAAKAAWTDMYGTVYCGTEYDNSWFAGDWFYLDTSPGGPNEAYDFYASIYYPSIDHHIWYFVRNNMSSECGPNETPAYTYNGYYVTAPDHPNEAY